MLLQGSNGYFNRKFIFGDRSTTKTLILPVADYEVWLIGGGGNSGASWSGGAGGVCIHRFKNTEDYRIEITSNQYSYLYNASSGGSTIAIANPASNYTGGTASGGTETYAGGSGYSDSFVGGGAGCMGASVLGGGYTSKGGMGCASYCFSFYNQNGSGFHPFSHSKGTPAVAGEHNEWWTPWDWMGLLSGGGGAWNFSSGPYTEVNGENGGPGGGGGAGFTSGGGKGGIGGLMAGGGYGYPGGEGGPGGGGGGSITGSPVCKGGVAFAIVYWN